MLLSIIIPAREEERTIGQTIMQFRDNLRIPHETIVSDARSKDRTVEIARQFAHITVVFDGTKHTAGIGRNDGAKAATGDYLAFVDAGVEIPNPHEFFERALAHFRNNPDVVGVTGPQRATPGLETVADRLSYGFLNIMLRFQNNVLHRGEASGKFMLVRHDAFKKIGGFREDLVTREDGDFFCRLSRVGRTVYDSSLLIYHGARRPHAVGWARLWWIWISNTVSVTLFNKAIADDWTPIR
ncbi:MAG: glycosyltransferase [Candidatus Kaiserbacteria bacterium]|nr:glycosyltransferase [Candidatus Kaiserbacteria bacterium]